jgi:hypothetical protein
MKKIKYAVGSVAQAAAEGADSLLSEARKDVVAARGPERTTPVEVEEMAEAVSKTKGSAEAEAPEVKTENIKDTTKLVNSFEFQGGNAKMDKQFIMESLSEVADTPIVESKQSIAEFITDLHRTQMDEESKPLLANDDFEKLGAFAESDREAKNEGGEMGDSDVAKLIMLTKQYDKEYDKAKTDKSRKTIDGRFQKVVDSFDDETRFQAMVKMNEENPEHEMFDEEDPERQGKIFGGLIKKVMSSAGGGNSAVLADVAEAGSGPTKIIAEGQSPDAAASISALEGPDPIEPSNNRPNPAAEVEAPGTTTKIGYAEGGDVDEREAYGIGSIAKKVSKAVQKGVKKEDTKDTADLEKKETKPRKPYNPRRSTLEIAKEAEARDYRGGEVTAFKLDMSEEDKARKLKRSQIPEGPHEFRKAFREAWKNKEETFAYDGKEFKVSEEILPGRKKYEEGGSLLSDEMPVDTYDNIPEDEMAEVEASQLPDDEMEDEYSEFVMDESLTPEDQEYLLKALEGDEKLGDIFDKIMDTAGEFAGEGAVKGPGTGTSDSIPARLSDGEFVFTRKATDQIGTDKLQTMMDDAERAYDGGLMKKYGGGNVMSGLMEMQDPDMGVHNQMLKANAMPSVQKR